MNVLVANPDVVERLGVEQRDRLRQAAAGAAEMAVAELPDEARAAAAYCAFGGGVALTTDDALAELHEAVAPVYAELESDAATKALIDEIRAVKETLSTPTMSEITTCEPEVAAVEREDRARVVEPDVPLPEGVLRIELTEDELRAAGVPEHAIAPNQGVYTMTFRDGEWLQDGEEDEPGTSDHRGRYTVRGDVLSVSLSEPASDAFCCEYYRWKVDGDEVIFEALAIEPLDLIWERMGGALLSGQTWTKLAD